MKSTKITISDIAQVLEVSTISVSRALSGQTGVSDELRSRIIEMAKEMGYVKSKNNNDINILVLHQRPYIQDNSNFSYMVQGIEAAIQNTGAEYSVEFVSKENQDKMYLPSKIARGNNFDGVIFVGKFKNKYVEFINKKIKNIVFYTGYSPSYNFDSILFNFINSGYKQCEYLINKGHTLIGFIGNNDNFRDKEKLLGITTALEDYKIPVRNEFFLNTDGNFDEMASDLINKKPKPTAVICNLDFTAVKLIKFLYDRGLSVPEDISVIGSGNTEMSTLSIPALTTLDLNIDYSCEAAVKLLLRRINHSAKPFETISINSCLIERDSVKSLI